jgi:hypothetical protein
VYVAFAVVLNASAAAQLNVVGKPVGKLTVGSLAGKTVNICEPLAEFPQASVTVQDRVNV